MSTAYSTRFAKASGQVTYAAFQVPPGHRAVARSLAFAANNAPAGRVWVACAGVFVYSRSIPGAYDAGWNELRLTAYANEFLELIVENGDVRAQLDGFLFADSSGTAAAGQHPVLDHGRAERPTPEAKPK